MCPTPANCCHQSPTQHRRLTLQHNGQRFADNNFKYIFLKEDACIWNRLSLTCVSGGSTGNMSALVQAINGLVPCRQWWPRYLMPYCITRPQWVNHSCGELFCRTIKKYLPSLKFPYTSCEDAGSWNLPLYGRGRLIYPIWPIIWLLIKGARVSEAHGIGLVLW